MSDLVNPLQREAGRPAATPPGRALHHVGRQPFVSRPGRGLAPRSMRITLIDGHRLFADALAIVLEDEGYVVSAIEVRAAKASHATVLAAGLRSAGRLVLLEHGLGPAGSGIRLIAPLTAAGAIVVLLTDSRDELVWGEAVRRGASQVLHKTCSLQQVLDTARRVRDGEALMTPERRAGLVNAALAEHEEVRAIRSRLDRLTGCEAQILGMLMRGEGVRAIARARVVEQATVRSQVKSVLGKLEATSQIVAVAAAHRVGWQPPRAEDRHP